MVSLCLERGADANASAMDGTTPLHWAAQEGSAAVCEALLAAGADPAALSRDGRSVLCEVVRFGGVGDVVDRTRVLLAQPGLDLLSTYKGRSPEEWAREKQLPAIAAMMAEEVRVVFVFLKRLPCLCWPGCCSAGQKPTHSLKKGGIRSLEIGSM